jgi:hypothetical protein
MLEVCPGEKLFVDRGVTLWLNWDEVIADGGTLLNFGVAAEELCWSLTILGSPPFVNSPK